MQKEIIKSEENKLFRKENKNIVDRMAKTRMGLLSHPEILKVIIDCDLLINDKLELVFTPRMGRVKPHLKPNERVLLRNIPIDQYIEEITLDAIHFVIAYHNKDRIKIIMQQFYNKIRENGQFDEFFLKRNKRLFVEELIKHVNSSFLKEHKDEILYQIHLSQKRFIMEMLEYVSEQNIKQIYHSLGVYKDEYFTNDCLYYKLALPRVDFNKFSWV